MSLSRVSPDCKVIGVPMSYFEADLEEEDSPLKKEELDVFKSILSNLKTCGAILVEDIHFSEDSKKILKAAEDDTKLDGEFAEAIAGYFETLSHNPTGVKNLNDLIEFTKNTPAEEAIERNIVRLATCRNASANSMYRHYGRR